MRPSGENHELVHGEQRAVVVEVGGGLRTYAVGRREVLDGYAEDAMCTSGRGQVLAPWPNRIAEAAYDFDGVRYELPVTERSTGSAIHGLVRWGSWHVVERTDDAIRLEHRLHPQPGYPFDVLLSVQYALDERGLTVETRAENAGGRTCPFGAGHHPYLLPLGAGVDDAEVELPVPGRDGGRVGATKLDTTFGDLSRDGDGIARARVDDVELWLDGSWRYLQVFTGDLPDVARRSIAIEPMTCPPNAFRTGEGLLRLEPGEGFAGRWGIRLA